MHQISSIATVGEILVEFVSHTKGCALERIGPYSGPFPSGAPAIFLDQAARMGAKTQMFGGVGSDGFGRAVLNRLRDDGIDTDGVSVVDGKSTGTAFVSYYEDGSRDFIFHLANTAADSFTFDPARLNGESVMLHVSAASLGSAPLRAEIMKAVRHVLDTGGKICCDPNARPELMRDTAAKDALQEVVAQSYILMPSTSDLGFLYPDLDEEAAVEKMLQSNVEIVVVKRGAGGSTVIGNGERHDFTGHTVDEIDPTGAGDCFCGTFVSLVTLGASLEEAGRMANAAGALAVTRRGPMEGNSTPDDIKAFLAKQNTPHAGVSS